LAKAVTVSVGRGEQLDLAAAEPLGNAAVEELPHRPLDLGIAQSLGALAQARAVAAHQEFA
jgi:hypothetical protein